MIDNKKQTICIIGGGISGLATAYFLEKQAQENGLPLEIVLVERAATLGGKIATHRQGDFIMEGGPESFVTRKPEAWDLCHELGIGERLVGTTGSGKNYVLHNGRSQPVPTNPIAFIKTPLLTASGKLRLLKEPFIPPRSDNGDESLGSFLRRRIGDEAVDNLAKPAIGSIYLGDVDEMSVQVSFSRFAELEREYGSLVKGMFGLMKQKRSQRKASGEPKAEKKPPFATLRGGLMELIDALADQMGGEIWLETAVTAIHHDPSQPQPYQISFNKRDPIRANAIVLAVPTFVMGNLLAQHDTAVAEFLRGVSYNPVATVNLSFNRSEINDPFDGFGVVVPESESCQLLAVEGMSNKFPHRAPDDQFVLRAFVGGKRQADLVILPDDALIKLVRQELETIFSITAKPTYSKIFRWQPANPQPEVGHLEMVTAVEKRLNQLLPNLYLTGAGMRGQGVPDCIRQANILTDKIMQQLNPTSGRFEQKLPPSVEPPGGL
jgi:oxygen-dependent protoporphyrinogen oxidase